MQGVIALFVLPALDGKELVNPRDPIAKVSDTPRSLPQVCQMSNALTLAQPLHSLLA